MNVIVYYYHSVLLRILKCHSSSFPSLSSGGTKPTAEGEGGFTVSPVASFAAESPVTVALIDFRVNDVHPRHPTRAASAGISAAVRATESV